MVSLSISETGDDAYDLSGALGTTENSWQVGNNSFLGAATAGLRFQSSGLAQGAPIAAATLSINVTAITGTPQSTVHGVDVDDAAQWSDPGVLPSGVDRTTASTAFNPTGTGIATVDVTSQIQEIVNRAGFAGGAIALVLVDAAGSGDNLFNGEDFSDAGTDEATLEITLALGAKNMLLMGVG